MRKRMQRINKKGKWIITKMASDKEKRFKTDLEYRIYRILHLAKKYRWQLQKYDAEKLEFKDKEGCTLNINYRSLKVATALNHPRWGNTVLSREGELSQKNIESIFRNPRSHMPANIKSKYEKLHS